MQTSRNLLGIALGAWACSSELAAPAAGFGVQSATEAAAEPGAAAVTPRSDTASQMPVFGETDTAPRAPGYFNGETCAASSSSPEVSPAVLELLVDTSGSMNDDAPGTGESKWTVTRNALLAAIDALPDTLAVGVVFYPNVPQNADPCFDRQTAVPIERLGPAGAPQRQAIEQAFAAKQPDGGTPTHDAYQYALAQLAQSSAFGRRFLVLITDGVPTFSLGCVSAGPAGGFPPFLQQQQPVDAAPLIDEAESALGREIRTFVIGAPGSEGAADSLSRMAEAGGTPRPSCSHQGPEYCHFDMSSESDLAAGLGQSLSLIASASVCGYSVPDAPGGSVLDPGKVNLLYTPTGGEQELIQQNADAACAEGWQYAEDETLIRLCPSTCERVLDGRGQVTLQFGCLTVVR